MKTKNKSGLLLITIFFLTAGTITVIYLHNPNSTSVHAPQPPADSMVATAPANDTLPYLISPVDELTLPDSTCIIMIKGAVVMPEKKFPIFRQVKADGDLFFDIPTGKQPFIVRTNLLVLTAHGPCTFRVIAYAKQGAEEVQVLHGMVKVQKSYQSDFPEADTLRDNQLLMINRSIDLMEKEDYDTKELKEWWDCKRQ